MRVQPPTRRAAAAPRANPHRAAAPTDRTGSIHVDAAAAVPLRPPSVPWLVKLRRRLGDREFRRRLMHIAPGLLPFVLLPIPHEDPLSPLLLWIMIGLGVAVSAFAFWK